MMKTLPSGLWITIAIMILSCGSALAEGPLRSSSCMLCHGELDDELSAPLRYWASDVHAKVDLGCEGCHGGDPSTDLADDSDAAMDPAKGFQPAPTRLQVAEFCARCHSDADFMKRFNPQARVDQLAEYRTSVHGIRNQAGDATPATCIDCHGVHGIRTVSSPTSPVYAANVPETCGRCHSDKEKMAPYGIPTNQYEGYSRSMHAATLIERGDLAAPACNDCHGNHGAVPPGVKSVANVCGQCHGREANLFRQSAKKELFDEMGKGECAVCHGHHMILHPTPEMFHSESAPRLTKGTIARTDPIEAHLGALEVGERVTLSWRLVIAPHLASDDVRLHHRIEIAAHGIQPVFLDATVLPEHRVADSETPRLVEAESFRVGLTIDPLSGDPVKTGDALLFQIELEATQEVQSVTIRDLPGEGLQPVSGSVCLGCHSSGDDCDQATERMVAAIGDLDRELRHAADLLHEAEVAGMEVSGAQFELKSKGVTAAVESRALIHTFDPEKLIQRAGEGMEVAESARTSALAALQEIQNRRKGLAVALGLIAVLLIGLYAKIRQVDRKKREV